MITIDSSECSKQVREFAEKTKANLHQMVKRFAVHLAETASNNTPIGNEQILNKWNQMHVLGMSRGVSTSLPANERRYLEYYLARRDRHGLPMQVGFHRGSWEYSENSNFSFNANITPTDQMLAEISAKFDSNYSLGDTFYVGANGPGFKYLEGIGSEPSSEQAPNGIMKPTVDEVIQAYSANLQYFYRSN